MSEHETPYRGAAIMVSYRELLEIRTQMANMAGQLTAALALRGVVDKLADRVHSLEINQASQKGGSQAMKLMATGLVSLAAALIGAVGGKLLPF
jgi:hypothetical protein